MMSRRTLGILLSLKAIYHEQGFPGERLLQDSTSWPSSIHLSLYQTRAPPPPPRWLARSVGLAQCSFSRRRFLQRRTLPSNVPFYTDEDEWTSWKKIGDEVLHIELRKWADIMVIAPLSANTLAKIAGGLCDNLLTCVVRAWDFHKPIYVAPAMNTCMWNNPFTKHHLEVIRQFGFRFLSVTDPITRTPACGDHGNGVMVEPHVIFSIVRLSYKPPATGPS